MTLAEAVKAEEQLSDELAPYEGRWVAVSNHEVVADADGLDSLLETLSLKGIKAERVFRVLPDSHTTLLF